MCVCVCLLCVRACACILISPPTSLHPLSSRLNSVPPPPPPICPKTNIYKKKIYIKEHYGGRWIIQLDKYSFQQEVFWDGLKKKKCFVCVCVHVHVRTRAHASLCVCVYVRARACVCVRARAYLCRYGARGIEYDDIFEVLCSYTFLRFLCSYTFLRFYVAIHF